MPKAAIASGKEDGSPLEVKFSHRRQDARTTGPLSAGRADLLEQLGLLGLLLLRREFAHLHGVLQKQCSPKNETNIIARSVLFRHLTKQTNMKPIKLRHA